MGNVIPWSQIHPSIKSEEPFVAVVIVDPQHELCVSEMVDLDPEVLKDAATAAGAAVAAAQAAVTRVASGYRQQRRAEPRESSPQGQPKLRLLDGGLGSQSYGARRVIDGRRRG